MAELSQCEVLSTDLLHESAIAKILAAIINVKTPKAVLPENFSIQRLDHYGRVAVVKHMGVEVLLLFKRMTSQVGTLHLEVSARANLIDKKLGDSEDAWQSFRLVEIYPGIPLQDRILELERDVKNYQDLAAALQHQLEEADILNEDLLGKVIKKTSKTLPPAVPSVLTSSPATNALLLKIKPLKLQDVVREHFLWSQGFDTALKATSAGAPDVPVKMKKKLFRYLDKLHKLQKHAKRFKELCAYEARPPKPPKVKKPKKAKKKAVKKVAVKKVAITKTAVKSKYTFKKRTK